MAARSMPPSRAARTAFSTASALPSASEMVLTPLTFPWSMSAKTSSAQPRERVSGIGAMPRQRRAWLAMSSSRRCACGVPSAMRRCTAIFIFSTLEASAGRPCRRKMGFCTSSTSGPRRATYIGPCSRWKACSFATKAGCSYASTKSRSSETHWSSERSSSASSVGDACENEAI